MQYAVVVTTNAVHQALDKVIRLPTCGLRGVTTARCGKPRCANFLWEKQGYVNAVAYGPELNPPPPPPTLKFHTFLDTKHLHGGWVAHATHFRDGGVSAFNRVYLNFSAFDKFPPPPQNV
jgi:hypothetical protein